jgi:LytS/YehU family sensor histidine kinase
LKWKNILPFQVKVQYSILSGIVAWAALFLLIYRDFNTMHSKPGINLLLYLVPFILLSITLGMLIKLVRMNENALEDAKITASQSQSELKLLQSQISPHFLFNTLNNLYGISLTRHEMIPPLLLKLSDLLRYSVYDAKELFVPLRDELAYINNYIDFEKLRIGDRLIINTDITEEVDGLQIAPMILIIFVENAFKHSKNSTDQNIYIDIELKSWANSILFSIKNSYQENQEKGFDKYSGFGLENVRKRLELLYPGKYDLKTEVKDDFYKVMLQLKVK